MAITKIKACGGDRSKNLSGIADAIDNMLPTTGAAVTLQPDNVHKLKGYVEQLGIIADEIGKPVSLKVHILMESDEGNYTPALVTTSNEKAKAKYIEIIKASASDVATDDVEEIEHREAVGFDFGREKNSTNEVVLIDGTWYYTTDDMDDAFVLWFEEGVS